MPSTPAESSERRGATLSSKVNLPGSEDPVRVESMSPELKVWYPHGGVRPFHQKSTCLPQLTSGPYVVQIWSRSPRNCEATKPAYSTVRVNGTNRLSKRHSCVRRTIPHDGVRPFHRKSTCLPQSTSGPYVVQIWSRYAHCFQREKPLNSTVWQLICTWNAWTVMGCQLTCDHSRLVFSMVDGCVCTCPARGWSRYRGTSLSKNTHPPRITIGP